MKKKILIVEDERVVAEDIRNTLQKLGYVVSSIVSSGEAAVKKAEEDKPDLVLMDIVLWGKIDGVEAAKQIRSNFRIPVVYLTAYADEEILERAKTAEPFGYILKPFEDRELHSNIEMALYKSQAEKRIEHLNAVLHTIRKVNRLITEEKDRDRLLQGTCNNLIETRGYHSAWLVLLDESGGLVTSTEAGLGEVFLPLAERLKRGELADCAQRALKQSKVVVIQDPSSTCVNCPLAGMYHDRGAITTRLEHSGKVYGVLSASIPRALVADEEEQALFQEVAENIAFALHNIEVEAKRKWAEEELQQSLKRLQRTLRETVNTLALALEVRDPYTAGHQQRVTQLACAIAEEMGLSKEQIEGIRVAGTLHDIGKMHVPAEILSKPTRLTEAEFDMIKTHPTVGHDVLKGIEFPWPVAEIVLQHHERMDGSGYPQGISGEEILMEARILGVADVVEAMASHRPYRPAQGIDKALEEISQNRGVLYDSEVVDACLRLFTEKGFKFE